MSRKDQVYRAVKMQGPDYVPILHHNKDRDQSDIIVAGVVRDFMGEERNLSEWGYKWERHDETMGQPVDVVINSYDELSSMSIPDPFDKSRYDTIAVAKKEFGEDRFYIAGLGLTGFTLMTFIRGFENTLMDLYSDRENLEKLADIIFGFEENLILQLANYDVDAVCFSDDWGMQDSLIISPDMWREFFKPRYKKQFDLAHEKGLYVYFHCCGNIIDIIPDLIEIGVDMLNISQPNIFDIKKLGKDFGGKTCFVCPVSYQTTSLFGTKEEIYEDVRALVENLGCFNGGLVGYVEEYHSIGLSDENYNHCLNAFRELGRYKK